EVVDGAGGTLEDVIGEEGLVNDLAGIGLNLDAGIASVNIGGDDTQVSVEARDASTASSRTSSTRHLKTKPASCRSISPTVTSRSLSRRSSRAATPLTSTASTRTPRC